MQKINLTKSEILHIQNKIESCDFTTNLQFLKQHKGLKAGKMHMILGAPSGGKSTLRNTLLMDFLKNNPDKIACLYLSEESVDDFKFDLVDNPYMIPFLDRIRIFSEQDKPVKNPEKELKDLFEQVILSDAGVFIFDNITTSELYGERFDQQTKVSKEIKNFLSILGNCALVLMAHTDSTVKTSNRKMIDQNEIRGSKRIINLCEFLYILQTFYLDDIVYTILKITKHRANAVDHRIFRLLFDKTTRTYEKDIRIDSETYYNFFNVPRGNKTRN